VRRIKEEEPPKPSTRLSHSGDRLASIAATRRTEPARLTNLMRGELDWIVMKALEKERTRRYETANALPRDVQRYLDGDAVEAGPPLASYKLRKFARKHRAALMTVGAFVLLLIAASVVSTYLAVRATGAERAAREERNRAVAAEGEAVQQRDRAVEAEREAKTAADRATNEAAIARAVNDFLQQDLLGQADVDNQAGPGQKPDPEIKVRTLLDRAAAAIGGQFAAQPAVEVAIRRTIGDTYVALGLYPLAEAQLEQALALARRALGDQHRDALNAMTSLAKLYWYQGRYVKAEPLCAAALQGLERVRGEEHPDTLRAMKHLAWVLQSSGKLSQAEVLLVKTLKLCRTVFGEDHIDTLSAMNSLGIAYSSNGKFAESEALLTRALALAPHARGENGMTLSLKVNLAWLYIRQGMYAQADELSAKALEGLRRLLGAEHFLTFIAMGMRGDLLSKMGKIADAEALLTEALEGYRRTVGEEHYYACSAMAMLAESYQAQGRLAEAETLFRQARAGERHTLGDNNIRILFAANPLAELYLDEGRPEKAEPLLVEAQRVAADSDDGGNPAIAHTAAALARLRLVQRKPSEAEPPARQALAIRLDRHPDHWTHYDALSLVGAALAGQKKYAEAEPLLIQAYEGLKEREARIPFLWRKKRPAEAGARIVDFYDAWGKSDKANEWRKNLGSSPKP